MYEEGVAYYGARVCPIHGRYWSADCPVCAEEAAKPLIRELIVRLTRDGVSVRVVDQHEDQRQA